LTERLSQGRIDLFQKEFLDILRAMIWITMPVIIVSYFARGYLARLIFGDVAPEVALIFGYLTLAILFRIVYSMVSRYFYAFKDTTTPLVVSIFAIALNVYLAFALAKPDTWSISGLALAQSIVAVVEVTLLLAVIFYRNPGFFNINFLGGIVRILSVSGFSMMTTFFTISLLPLQISDRGVVTLGAKFGFIAVSTLLIHLVISYVFGLSEARVVIHKIKAVILSPPKQQF
jgi:putative peptidoglycan lipid II flippase